MEFYFITPIEIRVVKRIKLIGLARILEKSNWPDFMFDYLKSLIDLTRI